MRVVEEVTVAAKSERPPVLALIAHGGKINDLLQFVRSHRHQLAQFRVMAPNSTGVLVALELGVPVECIPSSDAGYEQIRSRIGRGRVDAVIFLRDPAHIDQNVQTLLDTCDLNGIPLATNRASADFLLRSLVSRSTFVTRSFHPSVFSPGRFPWGSTDGRNRRPDKR